VDLKSNKEMNKILKHYGIDITDQLSAMLSEELAKQIDKEILQGISNLGKNNIRKRKIENILKSFE
jgi:mevalonate kinase